MGRPVTLFTGQWADLDCETIITKAKAMGYDGVEFGCWGDHFEVANADATYCAAKRALLDKHGMKCFAISSHLVGQAFNYNIVDLSVPCTIISSGPGNQDALDQLLSIVALVMAKNVAVIDGRPTQVTIGGVEAPAYEITVKMQAQAE